MLIELDFQTHEFLSHKILRVTIEDTGIGIPDEARKKLFQPYARAQLMTGLLSSAQCTSAQLSSIQFSTAQLNSSPIFSNFGLKLECDIIKILF